MTTSSKIFVAGGADGQLARSLAEAATTAGDPKPNVVAVGPPTLDLLQPASIASTIARCRPELVINCAAYTAVDKAETEQQQARAINVEGAAALADLCDRESIPLIHISTDFVFSGTLERSYIESDSTGPNNVYGHSKLEGERCVAAACAQHIILRTSWLYSPWSNNFVRTMLRLALERSEISVVDDQIGCPTYAPHLAVAILEIADLILAAQNAEPPWGIYHVAGSGETSWCGFARQIFAESACHGGPAARVMPITTEQYPTPARRPANSRLDCTKLKACFGIQLPHWHVGTAECVAKLVSRQ